MVVAFPSYWLKLWMNGYGLFHYRGANQRLNYFCCPSSRYIVFSLILHEETSCMWCTTRSSTDVYSVQKHCHCWSSTTVYQSEFQCESKQADPADVSVQKSPWSWGCPEPSWRCLLHAGCHSSLVNHSPPCKHHQWSPPVETRLELTNCRQSKIHL